MILIIIYVVIYIELPDALITELDKRAHGSDKASQRLNDWVSYYGQGIGAGGRT